MRACAPRSAATAVPSPSAIRRAPPALTVCRTLQCKNPRDPLVSLGVGLGQGVAVVLERP